MPLGTRVSLTRLCVHCVGVASTLGASVRFCLTVAEQEHFGRNTVGSGARVHPRGQLQGVRCPSCDCAMVPGPCDVLSMPSDCAMYRVCVCVCMCVFVRMFHML